MQGLVLALHIIICLLIMLVVLIQGGENVDITAAFGGVSQAAFGPRGTVSTLAKATWVLGAIFIATSITLTVWGSKGRVNSVLGNSAKQSAPAKPSRAPATPTPSPATPSNPFQR
ncbi:MAG: preprotein translocase subunit SecG [Acidobacteriota bacterium]|nr:preprotein translocase subunit SecG [Acidobacteriota bacterium]